jgi:hypothetical protein
MSSFFMRDTRLLGLQWKMQKRTIVIDEDLGFGYQSLGWLAGAWVLFLN